MELDRIRIDTEELAAAEQTARRLAALAHPVRIAILRQLAANDACCVKQVVARVGLAQSTVSQHLRVLVEAGLVRYRPERQSSRYSVDREALGAFTEEIAALLGTCCGGACLKKD